MTDRYYRRQGGPPALLPTLAYDDDGFPRTDLANNPKGREACGFVEGPPPPEVDPAANAVRWDGVAEAWIVEALPPPPPPTAAEVRAAINAERDRRIRQPFTFAGHAFDYDEQSQQRITGAAALAGFAMALSGAKPGNLRWHGGETDFVWIAHDNGLVPMDAPTCFGLGQAAAAWESAHVFAAKALKNQLDAGEDPAAIDLSQGWPGG